LEALPFTTTHLTRIDRIAFVKSSRRGGILRILWVENHARFVAVTRQFLRGHELTVVPSIEAARAALSAGLFEAVLVDFDLDDGKGDVFIRELRERPGRVIVVATSSHEDGNRALVAAGADAVCGKMEFSRIPKLLESFA
jgi:CheY-like chemotaxis protein